MPVPIEPEKFSIDEMMERLRKHSSDPVPQEGELVTRADGSQAIRVRKRKRRTHQPHKEEMRRHRRTRMIQISGALILLLLLVFTLGTAIIYANSAPFRENVVRMASQTSGARVEIEQFRVNPTRANANRMTLTWPEGNTLRELSMLGVSADIRPASFLGKSFTGEEITADQGLLSLAVAKAGEPLRTPALANAPAPVRFQRYAVSRLHVRMGDPVQPLVQVRETEASFQPFNDNGRPQLLLTRGDVSIRGWHNIKHDRSHIEFRGNEMDIVGMRLLHETDGRGFVELSGTVYPQQPTRPANLDVRMDNFLLTGIAGPDLGELIYGRIQSVSSPGSNTLTFTPDSDGTTSLSVSFRNSPTHSIGLTGFPFLASLARLLEDNWFEHPEFEVNATGILRRSGPVVAFENLNLEQKGRMILRGNIVMGADRRLNGRLEVGIAEAMVRSSSSRRIEALTGPAEDGFHWLSLTVSGHAKNPGDNFLELLDTSKANPPESGRPLPTNPSVPNFEDLTAPE